MKQTLVIAGAVLALSLGLRAQGNSNAGQLRALNAQALQLRGALYTADASQAPGLHAQAAQVLGTRQSVLEGLMASQPAQALELSFPSDVLADFSAAFPESAARLEQRGAWQGPLYYIVQDGVGLQTHKEMKQLKIGTEMVNLYSLSAVGTGSRCGEIVAATGVRSGATIVAESSSVLAGAPACSTTGAQNIVVIMVTFPSTPLAANITQNFLEGVFLGNLASGQTVSPDVSISDFWTQASDGKTWVNNSGTGAITIVGVKLAQDYTYCSGSSDNSGPVRQAAYTAAAPLVNYSNYNRAVFILPNNNSCPGWAGISSIGCWSSECPASGVCNYSWSWWRDDQVWNRGAGVNLGTHEMGHNLGLNHASSRSFTTEPVGPPGTTGTLSEYGDNFSTMGFWNYGFYGSAHQLNNLGWMNSTNVLPVTTSGTYTIQPYDQRPETGVVKALKIARGTGTTNAFLYVAYYPNDGNYLSQLNSNIHNGAIVHYQDSATVSGYTNLVAFTPVPAGGAFSPDFNNPTLQLGQTWQDPYTDLWVTIGSVVNNALSVTITYHPPPCTPANPSVTISPTSASVNQGSSASFTVAVKSNDSSTCSARNFNLSSLLAPSDPTMTPSYSASVVSVAPGATSNSTLKIVTTASTPVNTYTVNATATSADANNNVGTTNPNAGLTVTTAPLAAPSSFTATAQYTGTGKSKTFTGVLLKWVNNAPTATSFTLERCQVTGKGGNQTCTYSVLQQLLPLTPTTYSDPKTQTFASGTYKYEIRANNALTSSIWTVAQVTF